jgi:hypothetical protein
VQEAVELLALWRAQRDRCRPSVHATVGPVAEDDMPWHDAYTWRPDS